MADSKEKTKGCTGLDRPVEVCPMDQEEYALKMLIRSPGV